MNQTVKETFPEREKGESRAKQRQQLSKGRGKKGEATLPHLKNGKRQPQSRAKQRQQAKGNQFEGQETFPDPQKGQSRDKVGAAVGLSGRWMLMKRLAEMGWKNTFLWIHKK